MQFDENFFFYSLNFSYLCIIFSDRTDDGTKAIFHHEYYITGDGAASLYLRSIFAPPSLPEAEKGGRRDGADALPRRNARVGTARLERKPTRAGPWAVERRSAADRYQGREHFDILDLGGVEPKKRERGEF